MATQSPSQRTPLTADSSVAKQMRSSFESQLKTTGHSEIETWLDRVPEEQRAAVFLELLDAELDYLHERGQESSVEEYLSRFPEFEREVQAVFKSRSFPSLHASGVQSIDSTVDVPGSCTRTDHESAIEWQAGDTVGRYRLERQLGRGAFGEVWLGFDPELHRLVAIKLPRESVMGRPDRVYHFRDEARRAALLKHEGIVPVYDIGHVDAGTFIVSEFVDGPTLADRMRAGRISRDEAVQIVAHLANSLYQAHRAGLVHRDIKPSNILLRPDGTPAITDFGLAVTTAEQASASTGLAGTVAYMSPEQTQGNLAAIDERSDQYSLGVIFYQLLTDKHPYSGKNSAELLQQIVGCEPRPPREIDDSIPPELERICLRCLAKKPTDRYSNCLELANDLLTWNSPPERLPRVFAIALAILVSVLTIGSVLYAVHVKTKEPPPISPPTEIVAATPTYKWLKLLDHPLHEVACLKGELTDFWRLDESRQLLNIHSERNLWLLETQHQGKPSFQWQGSLRIAAKTGSVGLCWGLQEDENAVPKLQRKCFALLLQKFTVQEPAILSLQTLTATPFLGHEPWRENKSPWYIDRYDEIARATFQKPVDQFITLDVQVEGDQVQVMSEGQVVWKPTIVDQKWQEVLKKGEGAVGFVGFGNSVVVREATIKFLKSE